MYVCLYVRGGFDSLELLDKEGMRQGWERDERRLPSFFLDRYTLCLHGESACVLVVWVPGLWLPG